MVLWQLSYIHDNDFKLFVHIYKCQRLDISINIKIPLSGGHNEYDRYPTFVHEVLKFILKFIF